MKKLLVLLALLPSLAFAEVIATLPNQAGGKIVLTDEACVHDGKTYPNLSRAYNYGTDGQSNNGCWYVDSETVTVIWILMNGRSREARYPIENFTLRKRSGRNL